STGTRPLDTLTAVLATASFSSSDRVLASPSEPQVTRPWQPLSIMKEKCFSISAWSSSSLAWNLVVTAGKMPSHFFAAISGLLVGLEVDNAAGAGRRYGRTDGVRTPAIQEIGCVAADAALARAHAAAGLQLGTAPAAMAAQFAVAHVLAAAH